MRIHNKIECPWHKEISCLTEYVFYWDHYFKCERLGENFYVYNERK